MGRWHGKTTARGYGNQHQTIRRHRLKAYRPDDICSIGGEVLSVPQGSTPAECFDLAHDHVNGGYLPGLACSYHNREEGASRGNRLRKYTTPRGGGSDVTCGICRRVYHYAARICEVCGEHYHPTYAEQRTCGRACGWQLRRGGKPARTATPARKREPSGWAAARRW